MANLKDTEVDGNLNVSNELQVGDRNVMDEIDELNSNLDEMKNEVTLKSTIPEFVSYNEQGNDQLVYKDDNGFMIISGWYHTYGVQFDVTNALYCWTVAFETPFVTSDYVICATPRYIAGLPNVTIVKTTATSVTIGCDANVNGIWINWVAMGRWK